MLYSLPDYVSSCNSVVAADVGSLKDLKSGECSGTKRISRISSWCTSSLFGKSWSSLSKCGLTFYYLIFYPKYPPFVFWLISKNIIRFVPVLNVNFSLRTLMERLRKELSRLEANSAFPLASALPSLTFCFLTLNLVCDMLDCVCVCVSVYPVLPLVRMHRNQAGLC